jgi:hypothetical protein
MWCFIRSLDFSGIHSGRKRSCGRGRRKRVPGNWRGATSPENLWLLRCLRFTFGRVRWRGRGRAGRDKERMGGNRLDYDRGAGSVLVFALRG